MWSNTSQTWEGIYYLWLLELCPSWSSCSVCRHVKLESREAKNSFMSFARSAEYAFSKTDVQ